MSDQLIRWSERDPL